MAETIKTIKLSQIKVNAENPRTITGDKFLGMSMADYMQWLWNNPQSGQSPYKLFEGALTPHGKDGDGNLIYTYSGAQF